jgi:hypothetical protein
MLVGESGPREVLPESMWPGLVRFGRGAHSWQAITHRALEEGFEEADNGTWLPDQKSSGEDFDALQAHLEKSGTAYSASPERLTNAREVLGRTAITGRGCWVADKADKDHLEDLIELDGGNRILDNEQNLADFRQCDTEECLYPRHFNVLLGTPTGLRLPIYPNQLFYKQGNTGIVTAWGNRLPPASESRQALRELQKQCMPYVEPSDSLLTLSGIGQLVFIPHTGCWMVSTYYMQPSTGDRGRTQYDAYGRLVIPMAVRDKLGIKGTPSKLAHRVIWRVLGNEPLNGSRSQLNHLCGFRACAYPGHLSPTTHLMNVRHAGLMAISEEMFSGKKREVGLQKLRRSIGKNGVTRTNLDAFWNG